MEGMYNKLAITGQIIPSLILGLKLSQAGSEITIINNQPQLKSSESMKCEYLILRESEIQEIAQLTQKDEDHLKGHISQNVQSVTIQVDEAKTSLNLTDNKLYAMKYEDLETLLIERAQQVRNINFSGDVSNSNIAIFSSHSVDTHPTNQPSKQNDHQVEEIITLKDQYAAVFMTQGLSMSEKVQLVEDYNLSLSHKQLQNLCHLSFIVDNSSSPAEDICEIHITKAQGYILKRTTVNRSSGVHLIDDKDNTSQTNQDMYDLYIPENLNKQKLKDLTTNSEAISSLLKEKFNFGVCPKKIRVLSEAQKIIDCSSLTPSLFENVVLLGDAGQQTFEFSGQSKLTQIIEESIFLSKLVEQEKQRNGHIQNWSELLLNFSIQLQESRERRLKNNQQLTEDIMKYSNFENLYSDQTEYQICLRNKVSSKKLKNKGSGANSVYSGNKFTQSDDELLGTPNSSLHSLDKSLVDWETAQFEPSSQTGVKQPMPYFVFEVAKFNPAQTVKNGKTVINLALGDPKKENGYVLPEGYDTAVIDVIKKGTYNGYTHHQGALEARQAIVDKYSHPDFPFTAREVFLTFACHGAMFATISVLCSRGDNILIPNPTFPLAVTLCKNLGVNYKQYTLLPDQDWEIDLDHLESLIDHRTKGIYIVNPSNPCSSVWSKEHQYKILEIAKKYKIPILADEVYFGIVYPGKEYVPFANLDKDVPIISINSLSKTCLLPGWRFGWVIVYNRHGFFDKVLEHLDNFQKMIFPPSSMIQYALPKLFECYNEAYYTSINTRLAEMAAYVFEGLSDIRGIQPIKTSAGMFMMIRILNDQLVGIKDDKDFTLQLFEEQSVLTLPSWCFYSNGFFRIYIFMAKDTFVEFKQRLVEFLSKRYVDSQ